MFWNNSTCVGSNSPLSSHVLFLFSTFPISQFYSTAHFLTFRPLFPVLPVFVLSAFCFPVCDPQSSPRQSPPVFPTPSFSSFTLLYPPPQLLWRFAYVMPENVFAAWGFVTTFYVFEIEWNFFSFLFLFLIFYFVLFFFARDVWIWVWVVFLFSGAMPTKFSDTFMGELYLNLGI